MQMETVNPNNLFDDPETQEFVEDVVHELADNPPRMMAVISFHRDDENVACSYHNMELMDKMQAAANILLDILDEYILNNAGRIRQILVDSEGDDDEDDE